MPLRPCRRRIRFHPAAVIFLMAGCHMADPAPGMPSRVVSASGNNQQGTVALALAVPPAVRVEDSRGAPVPGILVHFSVSGGGGYVSGGSLKTDGSGLAAVEGWVLGTTVGRNSLLASIDGTNVGITITATALPGPPATVRVIGAEPLIALIDQAITPAPTVQVFDAFANLVVGVPVTFAVTTNSGTVTGATALTNAQGQAQVGSWILGTTPGTNRLTASTNNGVNAVFTANGLSGNPLLSTTTPTEQSGFLRFPVPAVPRARVTDPSGAPLAGISVAFAIASGGGTLTGTLATTGSDGSVSAGDWRLGPVAGVSTVVATLPAFPGPHLSFHATGAAAPFTIDVRFLTVMSADSRDAFVAAARRWMQIIVGDLPDQQLTLPADACAPGQPAINETIDDVVIYASVVAIDGPGNVLGSAGPCVHRTTSALTVVGSMRFDQDDLALLQGTNRLIPTILHEMGHVLGFGTSWAETARQDVGLTDPIYVGAEALSLWPSQNAILHYGGRPVPLEDFSIVGMRDIHWRESVFHTELMTGFIEAAGVPMPISKLTIATFKDMGYVVNYGAADSLAGNLFASAFATGPAIPLNDMVQQAIFEVTPDGRVHRIP